MMVFGAGGEPRPSSLTVRPGGFTARRSDREEQANETRIDCDRLYHFDQSQPIFPRYSMRYNIAFQMECRRHDAITNNSLSPTK